MTETDAPEIDPDRPLQGWHVGVAGYSFALLGDEVMPDAVLDGSIRVAGLPHAPAWLVGVVGHRGRALAVLDLGRFLGLSVLQEGPVLRVGSDASCVWALRVHDAQWIDGFESPCRVAQVPTSHPLAHRQPPPFAGGWVQPAMPAGGAPVGSVPAEPQTMQILHLGLLFQHPRIRELRS